MESGQVVVVGAEFVVLAVVGRGGASLDGSDSEGKLLLVVVGHDQEALPQGVGSVQAGTAAPADDEDAELSAYNDYLARLNAEVKGHGRWHGLRS